MLSARSFPLGEHGRVGQCDEALYNELVQAPLVLRLPDGSGALGRSQALVQPANLAATLLDLWGVLPNDPSAAEAVGWGDSPSRSGEADQPGACTQPTRLLVA